MRVRYLYILVRIKDLSDVWRVSRIRRITAVIQNVQYPPVSIATREKKNVF